MNRLGVIILIVISLTASTALAATPGRQQGKAAYEQGQYKQALAYLLTAFSHAPDDPEIKLTRQKAEELSLIETSDCESGVFELRVLRPEALRLSFQRSDFTTSVNKKRTDAIGQSGSIEREMRKGDYIWYR